MRRLQALHPSDPYGGGPFVFDTSLLHRVKIQIWHRLNQKRKQKHNRWGHLHGGASRPSRRLPWLCFCFRFWHDLCQIFLAQVINFDMDLSYLTQVIIVTYFKNRLTYADLWSVSTFLTWRQTCCVSNFLWHTPRTPVSGRIRGSSYWCKKMFWVR